MSMLPAAASEVSPPKVLLNRDQWIRLAVVGAFAAFSLVRVAPDLVRTVYPLGLFGNATSYANSYATNGDGVVVNAPAQAKGSDAILLGDRVRIDRIKPFDRKPGLARLGFTYDNPDRRLPVERAGKVRVLHLVAQREPIVSRGTTVLRILMYIASVFLGGILFLVKPGLLTGAFFVFCLGGEFPTTYSDLFLATSVDYPWRVIPAWIGDTLRGAAGPALLLFAICLFGTSPLRQRIAALTCAAIALLLGTLHAYGDWLLTYAARPAQRFDTFYADATTALTVVAVLLFAARFLRSKADQRTRAGLIVAGFAVAGLCRIAALELYPAHMSPWVNAALQTAPIVPIVIVWITVVGNRFYDVDFVASRGIVFVALTGALIGFVAIGEELTTYLFYQNVDLAYGVLIAIGMGFGALLERIKGFLDRLVDRFIFRGRHNQRLALEFISGYILDAENAEDVHRALLEDASHALQLSFGGILTRCARGDYELTNRYHWPEDLDIKLGADDELTREIVRSRGALTTFSGEDAGLNGHSFPTGRLTFAAPLFADHRVGAIVVYGHNISGLYLDPEERELLVRVVEHASLALREIAFARYRKLVTDSLITV
jgi:hypothetical protein